MKSQKMSEFLHPHTHFPFSGRMYPPGQGFILCLCGAFPAPSLRWPGPAIIARPDGTSFNIQNPIPHPSQKEKVLLETRRAKECQRGIAGAAERAKEGGRVPFESSDTRLGARCREFESPHSDHRSILRGTPIFYFLNCAVIVVWKRAIFCLFPSVCKE